MILLDLRQGRYLGLKSEHARSLAHQATGWPLASSSGDDVDHSPSCGPSPTLVAKLVAQGILSAEPQAPAAPAPLAEPERSFAAEVGDGATAVAPVRLVRFLASAAKTSMLLRLRSMEAIAAMVSKRRQRASRRAARGSHRLDDAVSTYLHLRPLLFTVRDKCLFDSLALLEFLAAEGFHPHWCIGVRTQPFAAHSWVQSGDLVLNDDHEHVRSYQLILCA